MKAAFFILLAVSADAGAIEGTVWYDARGEVAWVDGPAARESRPPFVPQWVAREERRDRALRGDSRPRGRWSSAWPVWGYGGGYWTGYRPHSRVWGPTFRCRSVPTSSFHLTRPSGGLRVIIR
jgi:hypothetical protein